MLRNTAFDEKSDYFNHLRMPLLALAEGEPKKVLDVGCATGGVLAYFKSRGATYAAGIEIFPEVAEAARRRPEVDEVVTGSIETADLPWPDHTFDLISASFVLEHVADPWAVLRKLRRVLKPGGQFIGSLPNVRHASVLLPLLCAGRWKYVEQGIMDWTHLRFFTQATIAELLQSTGFEQARIMPEVAGRKYMVANVLTGTLFRHMLAFAYNFSARNPLLVGDERTVRVPAEMAAQPA